MSQHFIFTSRANQPGHSWYYSARFLPREQRHLLMALVDWCDTVRQQISNCQDPNVAHAQLSWWNTEIEKLNAKQAQHPATRQLLAACQNTELPFNLLQEYLLSVAMDIDLHRYQTRRELDLYCERRGGYLSVLYTHVVGYEHPHTLDVAKNLGQHIQYLYLLRHLARDIARNYLYLPLDELDKNHISATELLRKESSPEFEQWFYQQVQQHQSAIDTLINSLSPKDRWAQRGQIILSTLYSRSLELAKTHKINPLHETLHLTPLQKLWTAWRGYRGLRFR
jgi:phytoene synthase